MMATIKNYSDDNDDKYFLFLEINVFQYLARDDFINKQYSLKEH
jgi:hypothetical protein